MAYLFFNINKFFCFFKNRFVVYFLFFIYLLIGTFGHFPWKADEPYSFDIVWNIITKNHWLIPYIGGDPFLEKPPFMYWLGAVCVYFCPWLAPHEAVKISIVFCLLIMIYSFCLALKQMYIEVLNSKYNISDWYFCGLCLLIGNIGLMEHIHKFTADISQLTGSFLSLSILMKLVSYKKKINFKIAFYQGVIFGFGMSIAFLSKGLLMIGVMFLAWSVCFVLLPFLRKCHGIVFITSSIFVLIIFTSPWLLFLYYKTPDLFYEWFWINNIGRFIGFSILGGHDNPFFSRICSIIINGFPSSFFLIMKFVTNIVKSKYYIFLYKKKWNKIFFEKIQCYPARSVAFVYLIVGLVVLLLSNSMRDIYLMPFLPVMSLLVVPFLTIEKICYNRTIVFILNSVFFLFLIIFYITILQLLYCNKPYLLSWFYKEINNYFPEFIFLQFNYLCIIFSFIITVLWFLIVYHRSSNLLLSWSVGITTIWCVIFLLFMPWIDLVRSYYKPFYQLHLFLSMQKCLATDGLGESELGMLHYITGISGRRIQAGHSGCGKSGSVNNDSLYCDYLLVYREITKKPFIKLSLLNWKLIWFGTRLGDNCIFMLFRKK